MRAPSFPEHFNLADYFLFDRLTEGRGARCALAFGERRWTYAEVADRTRRVARVLHGVGLRPEERVLLCLPDLPAFAWSFFGTLEAGGVVCMANPLAPDSDLVRLLEYTRATVLITVPDAAARLAATLAESARLRAVLLTPAAGSEASPEAPVQADALAGDGPPRVDLGAAMADAASERVWTTTRRDDPAIWLFTSGSTGRPKGAVHTHRDFAFNTELYAKRCIGWSEDDVCLSVPRLFFGYATGTNLMFPFAVGGTAALFSERPTPETLCAEVLRHRATILTNVPTMMARILDHDAEVRAAGGEGVDLSSLRFSVSAGEALPPALLERWLERFGTDVYDGIGSAEMFHIYITNRPGDVRAGSLGRVVDGYQARILPPEADEPGRPEVPEGEVGTLWVRGESVATGYHADRDASWETFHGLWCKSSDRFRRDSDGYYWFAGRADDLMKVGGRWVSPLEVEDCLLRHPDVAEAVVLGVDRDGLTVPKAYIVTRAGAAVDPEAIGEFVKERLAKHKYPREVEILPELPRNDRGKVDRRQLRARELQT